MSDHAQALLADLRYAILSEVGARTLYGILATKTKREDLRSLLTRLELESERVLERVRALADGLGGGRLRGALRRRLLATALARLAPLIGIGRILRLCQQAEETVSRWYASDSVYFASRGDHERAALCRELCLIKQVHAQALATWLSNARHLD